MSKPGRILIVDDEEKWCKELVEILEKNGFSAYAVENVPQALERLSTAIYHIVVLDIRLPNNTEGIDLLKELERRGLKEATRVIILSGYGTLQQARRAFKDYEVADFLEKDHFSPQIFLESVQQVFAQKVMINLGLEIEWQGNSSIEDMIANLEVDGKRIGRKPFLRKQLIEELEDLLCRLFHEAKTILVRPLTPGWSGSGVLRVQPFFEGRRRGQDVIVKFGDAKNIREEQRNFQHYVKGIIGGGRSTIILDLRYTLHLGGIAYSFLGAGNQLVDFAHFYHDIDVSKIIDVLNHLFQDTCGNWYANRNPIQLLDLAADYRRLFSYSTKKLERIVVRQLPSVRVQEKLTFTSLSSTREFTNSLVATVGPSFKRFTYTCTTHGDFNAHNLFVDQAGFTWLIDFETTAQGHILRDIAMLDSVIRFQLLHTQEATLEECLRMEEVLCSVEHFSQVNHLATAFTTDNQALAKAFAIVIHLRILAGGLVTPNDMSEYYIALFYNALNTLRFAPLEIIQYEHALLCASLLADRLGLSS